jgi:hypothetical protein
MPIDPSMLAKSIGTLNDLDPARDLPATLQQAVTAAKQLFDAQPPGSCWPTPTNSAQPAGILAAARIVCEDDART